MNDLSENRRVQVRFLLGPAGAGKTFQCLQEIRAELKRSPEGPPLLFLAPKQATFQIERQLLGDPALHGYTRLQILSFERCAEFVVDGMRLPLSRTLSETGRVMVLRALLGQRAAELQVFHSTARLPGFALQLSLLLREFQRAGVSAHALSELAGRLHTDAALGHKLHDTALLLKSYADWLRTHQLEDVNHLLDVATQALRTSRAARPRFAGVWLDGFAEMTQQETGFIAALAPCCDRATLAFCLEDRPDAQPSWLSPWSAIGQTFRKVYAAVSATLGRNPAVDVVKRGGGAARFSASPLLERIEAHWAAPTDSGGKGHETAAERCNQGSGTSAAALRIVECANREAEAVFAAREIRRFIRKEGRYRDCAVLVRRLDGYADLLLRVFRRYDIPCFLDQRQPMAHHPLAELTRCALRTAVFHWAREDWFGALKTGLLRADEADLDLLENTALAQGWQADAWLNPLTIPGDDSLSARLENVRQQVVPPFSALSHALQSRDEGITGVQLAAAIRAFWSDAGVESRLEEWTRARVSAADPNPALHQTVLEQLQGWLSDVELAFADERIAMREWLTILEAGLSGLTVGAIPPSLDQVLIGAIDRSRNPDLRRAFVLGVNEGVFPSPPERPRILSDAERARLEAENVALGSSQKQRLGHESYYGYIAFTRSRESLVVTYAKTNPAGEPIVPSPFVNRLREIAPGLEVEQFAGELAFHDAEHVCEIVPAVLRLAEADHAAVEVFVGLPPVAPILEKWRSVTRPTDADALTLDRSVADRLYPTRFATSVSALEQYAACPFKFFVARGLRAGERIEFEPDMRQRGSFQHRVLQVFQEHLSGERRRWRDVSAPEAEALIASIGETQLRAPENVIFHRDASAEFTARTLIRNLQKLAATLVTWARHYEFEPAASELTFDLKTDDAWRIALDGGRELLLNGRMDRVDLGRAKSGRVLATVIDYKSSARKLDNVKITAGLDLQLLSYLGVLRRVSALAEKLGAAEIIPVGAFYVSLAPKRAPARGRANGKPANPFQHIGRFQCNHLALFDNRGETKGVQFRIALKQGGGLAKNGNDGLPEAEFQALLELVENHLRRFATELLDGRIAIAPFFHAGVTACQRCDYAAVCRFDSWTQRYRVLQRSTGVLVSENGADNGGAE